jgi:FhuF 2Fe-2S C-terminal domain
VTAADHGATAPATASEELAALGPFFAVVPEEQASASSWRPMSELVDGSSVLAERVAAVRAFLATGTEQPDSAVELRVAASVVHLGLVARVLSPLLALAVLHRRGGRVRAADLLWQPTLGSMFPLSVRAGALDDGCVAFAEPECIGEFSAAIGRFGVNEHILRGNVASALVAAGRTLAEARPGLRDDIRTLIGDHMADAGDFEPDGSFRRRSCCLIYRAAPGRDGALCGDCVLAPARGPMET